MLDVKDHKLHGRNIDPKRANPRVGIKKIFVGRLDPACSEDDIRKYFEAFGKVILFECFLMIHINKMMHSISLV